jgi:ribosomal protein S27E
VAETYRAYRAACPNCGAPVEFRSAASASAVCGYCRSTLVREGEALRRIGESAELFDDHSPLQLGVTGRWQGLAFTLVGRLQYAYADGRWTEWHALFDASDLGQGLRSAWLSEDNGAYVLALDRPLNDRVPQAGTLFPGQKALIDGRAWEVASVVQAHVHAAEGELPRPPQPAGPDHAFVIADLRNAQDEVGTLDYAEPARPQWSVGRAVRLAELQLAGLRGLGSEKTLAGRSIECPSCGASLEIRLDSTQSVTCGQCHAVVDVSQGVGADLAHFAQNAVTEPQIPLGTVGTLALGTPQPLPWQVIGYLERCDLPAPGSDDEQTFWREYLLYHPTEGFVFLVDTEEGWSWVRPLTGVPVVQGDRATWAGARHARRWHYRAKTVHVIGEFYWRLRRDEPVEVTDYEGEGPNRRRRLSREQTTGPGGGEITWSAGETLEARAVAQAFGLDAQAGAALRRDAAPVAAGARGSGLGCAGVIILILLILFVVLLIARCSEDRCDEIRSTFGPASAEYQQCLARQRTSSGSGAYGGSWGSGGGGGGGHK